MYTRLFLCEGMCLLCNFSNISHFLPNTQNKGETDKWVWKTQTARNISLENNSLFLLQKPQIMIYWNTLQTSASMAEKPGALVICLYDPDEIDCFFFFSISYKIIAACHKLQTINASLSNYCLIYETFMKAFWTIAWPQRVCVCVCVLCIHALGLSMLCLACEQHMSDRKSAFLTIVVQAWRLPQARRRIQYHHLP